MSEREWHFYLRDMIGFAENVLVYTEELDQEVFVSSRLNYVAKPGVNRRGCYPYS